MDATIRNFAKAATNVQVSRKFGFRLTISRSGSSSEIRTAIKGFMDISVCIFLCDTGRKGQLNDVGYDVLGIKSQNNQGGCDH